MASENYPDPPDIRDCTPLERDEEYEPGLEGIFIFLFYNG